MTLYADAAATVAEILTDTAHGFAVPVTLTAPDGSTAEVSGIPADIGQTIDPETGVAVIGRRAHVTLSLAEIAEAGLGQPRGVQDEGSGVWAVAFQLPSSPTPQRFKVTSTMPDRLGALICMLEIIR